MARAHVDEEGAPREEVHAEVIDAQTGRLTNTGGWLRSGRFVGLSAQSPRLIDGPSPEAALRWGALIDRGDGFWTPYLGEIACDQTSGAQ